jgi:cellulose synthase/poly-beta-1,6-N-acetylglucosamine synthase-like glycosyltransferase
MDREFEIINNSGPAWPEGNGLVSIIVGVRDMAGTISSCIESLLQQEYKKKEIIIINDGSDDETPNIVKNYPVILVNTPKKGIAHARNLGFTMARGEFIAFTDADCVFDANWLRVMIPHFGDPAVQAISGVTVFRTDSSYSSIYRQFEFEKRNSRDENEPTFSGGPGSIFRRSILELVGGFKEEWFHAEDTQISFMIVDLGYKIIKEPNAITYHVPESGFRRLVQKGYRDSRAIVRAAMYHPKAGFKSKFLTTWFIPYDMVFQPIVYAILLVETPLLILGYLLYVYFPFFWFLSWLGYLILPTCILWFSMYCYSFLPAYSVATRAPPNRNRVGYFIKTQVLHMARSLVWGLGLLVGGLMALSYRRKYGNFKE